MYRTYFVPWYGMVYMHEYRPVVLNLGHWSQFGIPINYDKQGVLETCYNLVVTAPGELKT